MNFPIALPALAPQPTGHPASLPPTPPEPASDQKIAQPAAGSGSAETHQRDHAAQKEQKTAPPSAIQIKIMEILEQQAKEMAENAESASE
ncbi:hypothetical protein QO034_15085 [Sedimentitalea sp. JM2-8]|uniref:Uncharacterized protein n=1 Tax=Sedimentitalea xiamensis TaxID=3050037 RepID=A0ABT7FH33_9RHOB|nr:hypothetical protein [Sedimentitalea xiamensis]MDK3074423.1 hypothetical protein [Sedimentitalea xiamensis]